MKNEKNEKIRVVELFAGIGSQKMALRNIGVNHEVVGISEWDINSIISYDAIHTNDGIDYSKHLSKKEILNKLDDFNFSSNGKDTCNISRIREKRLRQLYNANKRTKNIGDISKNHNLPKCDLLTYSFPCQDISIAGKQKGFGKNKNTRSGLLWEVEKILQVYKDKKNLPKYLMLENVKNLIGKKFLNGFEEWLTVLDSIGYNSYFEVLNAKNFDTPQNRERVFCISIRKDVDDDSFKFDKGSLTNKTIKDILENKVDKRYYMKNKRVEELISLVKNNKTGKFPSFKDENDIKMSCALSSWEHRGQGWRKLSSTLCARDYKDPKVICVPVDASINNPKELIISNCITSRYDSGIQNHQSVGGVIVEKNETEFMIRKFTPKECWRLMGFVDMDFLKAQEVNSNTQLYKQAGNSIVVPVMESIFKKLIPKKYFMKK